MFAFITESQISSVVSSIECFSKIPALFMSISNLPYCAKTDWTAFLHPDTLETSPAAEIEFGTSFIASSTTRSSRPFRPINAPSLENALAIANPIPRVLPVIRTTLPSKKFFFTIINLVPFLLKRTFFFQAVK